MLAAYVHVANDQGQVFVFGPDDDVPAWAVPKITNPKAWAGKAPASPDSAADPPPKAGPGSSRDAWAAYARSQGIDVSDDVSRDDIIAAVEE